MTVMPPLKWEPVPGFSAYKASTHGVVHSVDRKLPDGRRRKGQPIRTDGPQSHLLTKKGTPTMGGLMILSGLIVSTLLWANLASRYVWIVLLVMVGFGLIGFYDDYLKVTKKSVRGLGAGRKFAGQIVLGVFIGFYLLYHPATSPYAAEISVPFYKNPIVADLGILIFRGQFAPHCGETTAAAESC